MYSKVIVNKKWYPPSTIYLITIISNNKNITLYRYIHCSRVYSLFEIPKTTDGFIIYIKSIPRKCTHNTLQFLRKVYIQVHWACLIFGGVLLPASIYTTSPQGVFRLCNFGPVPTVGGKNFHLSPTHLWTPMIKGFQSDGLQLYSLGCTYVSMKNYYTHVSPCIESNYTDKCFERGERIRHILRSVNLASAGLCVCGGGGDQKRCRSGRVKTADFTMEIRTEEESGHKTFISTLSSSYNLASSKGHWTGRSRFLVFI